MGGGYEETRAALWVSGEVAEAATSGGYTSKEDIYGRTGDLRVEDGEALAAAGLR